MNSYTPLESKILRFIQSMITINDRVLCRKTIEQVLSELIMAFKKPKSYWVSVTSKHSTKHNRKFINLIKSNNKIWKNIKGDTNKKDELD